MTVPDKKSFSSFPAGHLQVLEDYCEVSMQPSLLWVEQPWFSQPGSAGEVLQSSSQLHGPPLGLLQQFHALILGASELYTALHVGSHKSSVDGENLLPRPADHTPFDAAQGMVGLLACDCMLTTHVEFFIGHHPQFLLHRTALSHLSAQPVGVSGWSPVLVMLWL